MAEKLIRDLIKADNVRQASSSEMRRLLGRKLVEEAQEVLQVLMFDDSVISISNRQARLIEELADVGEVCSAIMRREGVPLDALKHKRESKKAQLGSFDSGRVMTNVERADPEGQMTILIERFCDLLGTPGLATSDDPDFHKKAAALVRRAMELGIVDNAS